MVETLETYLEHARQNQTEIQLIVGGQIAAPVAAIVRERNGSTFEFAIGPVILRMDLASVVVRTA